MGPEPAREPNGSTFAGLLRQLRLAAGLTQEQLATAAALSPRSISDLERGVNLTARRETVRLLADALSLTGAARTGFQAAARGLTPGQAFPAGGAATATRTLPRDIGAFTGRQPELRAVVRLAGSARKSGGIVGICAIGGMAGIGKTAFAIHAAHQLAPRFPDGQIFMSLHAHTPGQRPVEPASALASLLVTAGVDSGQIPAGVEERSRLWRDHLAGRQVLLLLDDVAGYDQIKPLLPGAAGSLVLITSRRHLTALDDAYLISLDTMPPDEAAALLIRLSGRPGLAATEPRDRRDHQAVRVPAARDRDDGRPAASSGLVRVRPGRRSGVRTGPAGPHAHGGPVGRGRVRPVLSGPGARTAAAVPSSCPAWRRRHRRLCRGSARRRRRWHDPPRAWRPCTTST